MTTLCDTIDTLAMVYLDDELDAAERRELELHLHQCVPCRDHVAAERKSLVDLRARLAPPPVPGLLHARIGRALDGEDRATAATRRRGALGKWALPGVAAIAAAAALAVFVAAPRSTDTSRGEAVARAAVNVQSSKRPLEVQGASTGPWLAQNFPQADVTVPMFDDTSVRVVGASKVRITGHDAAQIFYEVVAGPNRFELSAFVLKDVRAGELRGSKRALVGGLELWVTEMDSPGGRTSVVSFEDRDGWGYVFMSKAFSPQALLDVVVGSDLIRRTGERVR